MSRLKAIIFDVDGTLAATEETHRQAFNRAFEAFELPFSWSVPDYMRLLSISGGRERIFHFLKSQNFTAPGGGGLHEYALKVHRLKSELYREKLIADQLSLRCGVKRLIDEARQSGIKLAVATSTSLTNLVTVLDTALDENALSLFDSVTTCDLIINKKPSPAVYQYTLANLGLSAGDCIAIEDTSNGNRAALAAGLKTVITTHPFTIDEDFSGAALVVDQLGEPDRGFTLLSGSSFGASYVDIGLLEKIVEQEEPAEWYPRVAAAGRQ